MITVKAPAKVNMALDITGKRSDGYHLMRMVNFTCEPVDQLIFEEAEDITLSCDNADVPADGNNLILKAAKVLKTKTGCTRGAAITLKKRIPMQAGLAGGSADCAAALKGLNALWQLDLTDEKLAEIGLQLGADVPYCLDNRPALVEGIGEIITPIDPFPDYYLVIVKPDVSVSTPEAFNAFDHLDNVKHPDIDALLSAISQNRIADIARLSGNVFEPIVFALFPQIRAIKDKLTEAGADFALMSGSGSTVVGYFEEIKKAKAASGILMSDYYGFMTRVAKGKEVIR